MNDIDYDEDNQLFLFIFWFFSYLENKVLNLIVGVKIVFGCVGEDNVMDSVVLSEFKKTHARIQTIDN